MRFRVRNLRSGDNEPGILAFAAAHAGPYFLVGKHCLEADMVTLACITLAVQITGLLMYGVISALEWWKS